MERMSPVLLMGGGAWWRRPVPSSSSLQSGPPWSQTIQTSSSQTQN